VTANRSQSPRVVKDSVPLNRAERECGEERRTGMVGALKQPARRGSRLRMPSPGFCGHIDFSPPRDLPRNQRRLASSNETAPPAPLP